MYRNRMQIVTTFESTAPEQKLSEEAEPRFLFEQVVGALKHTSLDNPMLVEAAAVAFARCAKKKFRALIRTPAKYVLPDGDVINGPVWVASVSVTMPSDSVTAEELELLVDRLGATISIRSPEKTIHLVGALSTKITVVSDGLVSFSLKQRWYFV